MGKLGVNVNTFGVQCLMTFDDIGQRFGCKYLIYQSGNLMKCNLERCWPAYWIVVSLRSGQIRISAFYGTAKVLDDPDTLQLSVDRMVNWATIGSN